MVEGRDKVIPMPKQCTVKEVYKGHGDKAPYILNLSLGVEEWSVLFYALLNIFKVCILLDVERTNA
jgi:hypothetical protein